MQNVTLKVQATAETPYMDLVYEALVSGTVRLIASTDSLYEVTVCSHSCKP